MTIKPAPSFADFPLYNVDIQNTVGFAEPVNALASACAVAQNFSQRIGKSSWLAALVSVTAYHSFAKEVEAPGYAALPFMPSPC